MSDQGQPKRVGQTAAKPRKRGSRVPPPKAAAATAGVAAGAVALSPRAAAYRARRGPALSTVRAAHISRDLELAYIRSDMRRLIYIAGSLVVLMFLILLVVNR